MTTLAEGKKVKRVIVDLRLNGGGDNTTYGSLLSALSDATINRKGGLFVLIGRATFSAAANFAADVDRLTKAIFVGEPTGGGVEIYGDSVAVCAARKRSRGAHGDALLELRQRPWRPKARNQPRPSGRRRRRRLLAGRDPVLAAALGGLVRK